MTTEYHGWRQQNGTAHVDHDEVALPLRLDLANHSPTGFEWGYGGSGPAQLALAMLADALSDDDRALRLHQAFKWHVIAPLHDEDWTMPVAAVRRIADQLERDNS